MTQPQSFIVYRNPMEAAFWEMMSSGEFIPVIAGVLVFFAVFLIANRVLVGRSSWNTPAWKTNLALTLGAMAGVFTIWKLWL
jgi:hypothetical protein